MNIDEALRDPLLLGAALSDTDTWSAWRATLKAAFGIELSADDAETFAAVAGGRQPPSRRVRELWAIIGRRSGKSRVAALVAAYIAAFIDHRGKLSPGETGFVLVLAASKMQAGTVFGYIRAFFERSPVLRQQIEEVTADEIRLAGNIVIAVHSASFRTVRGRTLLAVIFDEVGYWRDETTSLPDVETYRAVLPALATTSGMLIGISSPYAQRGLLFTKHRDCFGKDDAETLIVQAGTEVFNPTIDRTIIEQAERDDPEAAESEWHANFRSDLSTFVERAVVERCVDVNVRERPFERKYRYVAFVDPSGGAHDSFTAAIAHREGERVVLDAMREWRAPFSPPEIVTEAVHLLRSYRVPAVRGDRYAAGWCEGEFRKAGIRYLPAEMTRSEIYLEALPLLMSETALLLDDRRLVGQIAMLERRTARGGRDSVDHMRGAADDLANSALGALVMAAKAAARDPSRGPIKVQGVAGYSPFTRRYAA